MLEGEGGLINLQMTLRTNSRDRLPPSLRGNSSTSMVRKEVMNDRGSCTGKVLERSAIFSNEQGHGSL